MTFPVVPLFCRQAPNRKSSLPGNFLRQVGMVKPWLDSGTKAAFLFGNDRRVLPKSH